MLCGLNYENLSASSDILELMDLLENEFKIIDKK